VIAFNLTLPAAISVMVLCLSPPAPENRADMFRQIGGRRNGSADRREEPPGQSKYPFGVD
jgi:hypothetical protein